MTVFYSFIIAMASVVEQLSNLQLDVLDNSWVEAIYHSEFLEVGDLPPEYEDAVDVSELRSIFKDIMKSIDQWLRSDTESDEEKSWATLTTRVQHEKILAVLAYYIDHGCKNVHTKEYRNRAILSSRVYYKLLSIPGYKAYHIYHSQLFAHSLACLGFPKAMCENDDHCYNSKELTREVNSIIKELRHFVLDLRAITEPLQLNPNDMNFEDILSNLVDVTGGAIVNKLSNVDKLELGNVSAVIYEIIDTLICKDQEPDSTAIRLLFKCLLPKFIASSLDSRNANNLVRASYVTYSGLLLTKFGKAALPGYIVLLQHLCYCQDGLERAEVRTARVNLVVGLMSLLPRKSYRKIVKWLLQLSNTSKVSHRQIAMEMLASLLSNEPEEVKTKPPKPTEVDSNAPMATDGETSQENGQPKENAPNDTQKEANTQNVNAQTEQESQNDGQIQLESQNDSLPQREENPAIENLCSTDSQMSSTDSNQEAEVTEEDVAGLLRQRAHTVPHAELLRAVYERVHDVSSTLRTRALALLAECITSDRLPMKDAVKELSGTGSVSRLLGVGARGVCDERAAVRRAAAALVLRVLAASHTPLPADNDLAILVGLCRDASILVRSTAISALGELMTLRSSEAVLDAFLNGPMHQLSDPENKVQEQVVNLIQQLLIDRLHKFVSRESDDPMPWSFLGGVTKHNMRRHLQKACSMLAKTGNCINHRLVDILSTHLGAVDDERDLQCLVLLTCAAKLVDYNDIGFAIDYYYKLAENEKERDVRLMSLTLELLGSWSRFTRTAQRTALRDHLVSRLAVNSQDGCRIACATLAANLDPDNLTWATELMQLCERRAIESGSVEEALRAADLSLVSSVPPSPALLQLFLGALADPPASCAGDARLGCCVAGAGRLCVRSRSAAATAAPALAALLPDAAAPLPARVNALLALSDICVRYTCIVEPQLVSVCGCLSRDAPAPLRRAAARALTRLLLGGYLRLRTPLYYRYCALLADEDHDVREPAEYYVTCCLTTDAIYHHFVDCVLHYNNDDTDSISFDARQLIYDVMLQRMSAVQKLNIQCRLAREVLGHAADVCDDQDVLPPALNHALLDTITLLCGPRIKLPRKPEKSGDADIDDLQERVTTNIVSHKMKRTVAEELVPAVLRLYGRLRAGGGQIAAYLVRLATDLLNDYRQEIEELIENDEELVERVRQFQETIGVQPTFGNARNLVTSSAPPEPETPRANKRRARAYAHSPRKRALRI